MSASLSPHPSYLALDRASLGRVAEHVRTHLEECRECRDYVAALAEPAPASGLLQIRQRIAKQPRKLPWAWLGAPLAAAAALVLFSGLRPQPSLPKEPLYIGDKGFSSVWIYVRHGSNTALWDGKKQVYAGDRLRLKVDPGRFKRVEVYSIKDPNAPELLYSGSVTPGQSATLPDAWEIDTEPGDERLLVAFSSEPIKPIWSDWLHGKAQPGVMLLPFVLPKSTAPDPNPGSTGP